MAKSSSFSVKPWVLACATAVTVAGCASAVPSSDLSAPVAETTGVANAVEFRADAEPVDAAVPVTGVLTLSDAVRRSLAHSPEIQSSLARVRAVQADAKQARLLPNPILTVAMRFPTEGGGSPVIEAGLTADLIAMLRRPGQINAADNRLRAAAAKALSEVLDVLAEVQQRYAAVQTLDELLVVLNERLATIERLLQLSRDRLQFGEGTRLDVLTLETQQVELQTEIAERRLELRDERLALARLIGEPSGAAEWPLTPWEPGDRIALPESRWMALALEKRPDVQARRYELDARGAELGLTRFAPFDGAEVGGEAERDDGDWAVGPAVSTPLPMFDWGQAKRQQAEAALIEARHDLTRVQRQVIEETRRAYAALAASQANLDRVRDALVPLQQRRLEQAEAQWRGGETDITGLLIAEQDLRAARTRQLELERRVSEALYRLQRAVGGPGVAASLVEPTTAPTTLPTVRAQRGSVPTTSAGSAMAQTAGAAEANRPE